MDSRLAFDQATAYATGIAQKTVPLSGLRKLMLPLPPLAEQHRIVVKMDELMAVCDRLEAARAEREATRNRLTTASLARLNAPDPDPATFADHARFALDNIRAFTTRPDQIKQLRHAILNLAVRGKLVPQDKKEGTGNELLFSLKQARSEWEVAGRIRKEKCQHAVADEEKYLEVPDTWTWARLAELGQTQTGTSPSSANPDLFGNFIPFVKPADLDGNQISHDGPGLSEVGLRHSRLVPAYSVLMVCIGATLGKVNKTTRPVCFNQQINSLTPFLHNLTDYIALSLKASGFQTLAWSKAGTGTLPIISKGKWENLPVPLPPLGEQHRIVAKVDELMARCDRLEPSLTTAADTRRRLLDALLAEALTPDIVQEQAA
jgi:type I restriction enzyme S subunit